MSSLVLPRNINKIFIDLDDTLVDFMGGVCKLFSIETHEETVKFIDNRRNHKEMWKRINKRGWVWWASLQKLPWADDMWDAANKACKNVVMLTSPSSTSGAGIAARGKIEWCLDNYGTNLTVITKHKHMCASKDSLLIDDYSVFVDKWREFGGIAVKLSRPWTPSGFRYQEIIKALNRI